MIVTDDTRRSEARQSRQAGGWTALHSWIFLAIVAVGMLVIGLQNRYHYLSPLGLGKAYRIDKLFGSIQEFDPNQGWVSALLQVGSPQALSMMESPGSRAVPMNMPGTMQSSPGESPEPGVAPPGAVHREDPSVSARKESVVPPPVVQAVKPKEAPELSMEEKYKAFQKAFPDFGKDEFQLANDDLYPDWKKNLAPKGSWGEFLVVYRDFIQWWNDAGSPPEPGYKLWKDFVSGKH
ncbi:MAG TPA: hypothetical protein VK463_07330 [Desulfomonilaceae bacterium]|nr:hypothetical protein [Desulfomonilaceae bacterium]